MVYKFYFNIALAKCQNDSKIVNPEGCGYRLNDFPSKIVGGYKAAVGGYILFNSILFL